MWLILEETLLLYLVHSKYNDKVTLKLALNPLIFTFFTPYNYYVPLYSYPCVSSVLDYRAYKELLLSPPLIMTFRAMTLTFFLEWEK